MQTITKKQYDSLTQSIYLKMMQNPKFDMDDMADVREQVFYLIDEWMEDNGIQNEDE